MTLSMVEGVPIQGSDALSEYAVAKLALITFPNGRHVFIGELKAPIAAVEFHIVKVLALAFKVNTNSSPLGP